jgi:hypothetical protein
MRKILLKCMVAAFTLVLGVVSDSLTNHLFSSEATSIDEIAPITVPYSIAQTSSCFPGLSADLSSFGSDYDYFPPRAFAEEQESNARIVEWYSKYLRTMDEPSYLSFAVPAVESYRFLWLRSFHHPVVVRISSADDRHLMTIKELDGAGGYEPGSLIVNRRRWLSESEWSNFSRRLDEACFWGLPTRNESRGFDGAEWILEGVNGCRYHVVDRWTPGTGAYREACLYLLKISDLGVDEASQDLY